MSSLGILPFVLGGEPTNLTL